MSWSDKYQVVIGLEVHAQLATQSKLFCGDSTAFGAEPNTHISPITMGHPGTLPKTNAKAVDYAIKMGLACGCEIEKDNYFARKNYFYPDLPKGYQISQHTTPICKGGLVRIKTADGSYRNVQLNRIHLEEDAGKSIHDLDPNFTCIDLNRAGTPLIEIVTEPDIFSADEAWQYVTEIRKLVRWLGICDGNMEEGSLRCDANISLRPIGTEKLGTRVEVKNLNSIRNVKKAIEFEVERLAALLDAGEKIQQQTRSFNADNDTTFAIRDKEEANDYRYFPDPDLAPFHLTDAFIADLQAQLPMLPNALIAKYNQDFGLSDYDAQQLCDELASAQYFETVIQHTQHYKAVANWMLGPIKQWLHEHHLEIADFPLAPERLADLLNLVDSGKVNFSVASSKLLGAMIENNLATALQLAEQLNLIQVSDTGELAAWVEQALAAMPDKVAEYRKGKKGLIGLFVGEVKKLSKGKADPKMVTALLEKALQS
ncbi:MAG: Asp-tRNA(Asn)/Glu-tRNA(Gln) amidotransferase GatCAB subunit B [Chitinophagaceae bacterium BSSC1]|nr:MAG: Asp-tRNA(Asn)/Glu-tRNA(Gln) amidotransferase GatCAB subunit B [Chitinophagaceae bacterium BSSC1]